MTTGWLVMGDLEMAGRLGGDAVACKLIGCEGGWLGGGELSFCPGPAGRTQSQLAPGACDTVKTRWSHGRTEEKSSW